VITETENFLLRKLFFLNKKHSEREEDLFLEKKKKTENTNAKSCLPEPE